MWDEKYRCWVNDPLFVYPGTELVRQGIAIQQWTGLVDKNGKEIYEGDFINFKIDYTVDCGSVDIIEWKNQEVHYDELNAGFFFGHKYKFQMLDRILPETIEVVGNIFENSELSMMEK